MRNSVSKVFIVIMVLATVNSTAGAGPSAGIRLAEKDQIIVTVASGRIRSQPDLKSKILKELNIGTRLPLVDERGGWFKVELSPKTETEDGEAGWISKTISAKFDASNPDPIFLEIAEKYLNRKSMNFKTASQLFEFLGPAADDAKTFEAGGDLRLKRLAALEAAIKEINYDTSQKSPFKEFLSKYGNEVIYHEPAGMWIVRSAQFWNLHERYKRYKVGEKIAWQAAKNPLPGECEGYVVCHLNYLRVTSGEYLNFYPGGEFSKQALTDITNLLDPIIADLPQKRTYYAASDISDRAEFNRILSELRNIVSRTPYIEKNRTIKQINQIAESYR